MTEPLVKQFAIYVPRGAMTTLDDWTRLAGEITPRTEIFIDGKYRAAVSRETFDSINPATGELIAPVSSADAEDVDAAVASGRAAFESGVWSQTSATHRKRVLRRLASCSSTTARSWHSWTRWTWANWSPRPIPSMCPRPQIFFAFYGEAIDKQGGEIAPTEPGNLALVTREPLGVIGAVTPWNFPLDLAVWKVAPALAAG